MSKGSNNKAMYCYMLHMSFSPNLSPGQAIGCRWVGDLQRTPPSSLLARALDSCVRLRMRVTRLVTQPRPLTRHRAAISNRLVNLG